jgi:ectoine hydroxylase-related dioxygenase (phytanoyl-CoA dioxygenase family)
MASVPLLAQINLQAQLDEKGYSITEEAADAEEAASFASRNKVTTTTRHKTAEEAAAAEEAASLASQHKHTTTTIATTTATITTTAFVNEITRERR